MNRDAESLLRNLREAIEDALARSQAVTEAMAALEREGHSPSLLVDVALGNKPSTESTDGAEFQDAAIAAAWDEQFLRALGITGGP